MDVGTLKGINGKENPLKTLEYLVGNLIVGKIKKGDGKIIRRVESFGPPGTIDIILPGLFLKNISPVDRLSTAFHENSVFLPSRRVE
jgi:hypothetical protein